MRKGLLQHKVFSCEYYEIFKSTFFTEHILWLLLWWEPPAMISLCTKYARKRVFTDLYSHIFYAELALKQGLTRFVGQPFWESNLLAVYVIIFLLA